MNKKSWVTVILDGTVSLTEIKKLLDKSYTLA
jgi:predicted DNA-binding protein (MmcQ/YjbR family)